MSQGGTDQKAYVIGNPYHKRKLVHLKSSIGREEIEAQIALKTLYSYDIISQISLLEETYKIYKDVFFDLEKFKREIKHHHTEFL